MNSIKRLKNKLLLIDSQSSYESIYEGEMRYINKNGEISAIYSSLYYSEDIGFNITKTNKLVQDKPTVTISIPFSRISKHHLDRNMQVYVADYCLREFKKYIDILNVELYNRSRPDNENGKYYIHTLGGEIVTNNAAFFAMCPQRDYEYGCGSTVYEIDDPQVLIPQLCVCIRIQVQFPLRRPRKTMQMLCHDLPKAVDKFIKEFDYSKLDDSLELARKQTLIRDWLKHSKYCAFIANGSILPRSKGTNLPLKNAVPFVSPQDDEIEICGVRGMGIRRGVTIIAGGGYSGKSTLLDAISVGIYDHILGDGRELCLTDSTALTISAEDGRSVKNVNISPFINGLSGCDTYHFSTDCASGSTSQAANVMEAVESGAKLLLIDEDRSATNFMIRDKMMKELIEKEPITPFTDRVNELFDVKGVSTILVIGGSGEYLSVADKIYLMNHFEICDATNKAKKIYATYGQSIDLPSPALWEQNRLLNADGFSSYPEGSGRERLEVSDMGFIIIGDEIIDVRGLHNIISKEQIDSLGYMVRYLEIQNNMPPININAKIDELYAAIENNGLDMIFSAYFTTTARFLDLPRKQELKAVINRMRKISMNV